MRSRSPFIDVVATARDREEALQLARQHRPDVITLDLIMPGMDGVEFLRRQIASRPTPVVACSIAHESAELALAAFDAGAVEFVQKPNALATDRVFEMAEQLIGKVKAAAQVQMLRVPPAIPQPPPGLPPWSEHRPARVDVTAIGISTGGPQALRALIPALPADFPVPILVVLHMPVVTPSCTRSVSMKFPLCTYSRLGKATCCAAARCSSPRPGGT